MPADGAQGPAAGPPKVSRPRLIERLDAVVPGGVGAVVASAGFGKSVLLAQWTRSLPSAHVGTVSLQARHNDAHAFAAALLEALGAGGLDVGGLTEDLLETGGGALGEPFVSRLLLELEHLEHELVLVLDDVQELTNPALLAELDHVLAHLPPKVRVVIAARWDPALQLRQLRMDGRLVDLRVDDLAFDATEGADLLGIVSDRELEPEQTLTLVERTDGWAAGLQMAGISLKGATDTSQFVDRFAGTDRLVVEYLTEEVLDTLDEPTQDFLLCTSVVSWFDVSLADALTGRRDAVHQLETIRQRSLFLVPIDGDGRFRYHHLFADLLRYRLRAQRGSDAAPLLRRRAAAWYLEQGHADEAIEQLLAVRDADAAWQVVHSVGRGLFERNRAGALSDWLVRIEDIQVPVSVDVQIDLLAAQTGSNRFALASATYQRLRRRDDLSPGQLLATQALRAVSGFDHVPPDEVQELAEHVLEHLPDVPPAQVTDFLGVGGAESVEVMAGFMAGMARLYGGDALGAAAAFGRCSALPGARYPAWGVHLFGAHALARELTGHLREAERLARGALDVAAEAGLSHHVATTSAHSTCVALALDRRDVAAASLELAEFGARAVRHRGATFNALHRLQVARLTGLVEGPQVALDVLAQAMSLPTSSRLLARAEQVLRIRLLIESGDLPAARSAALAADDVVASGVARVDLELASGDVAAARWALDRWVPRTGDLADEVEHLVRSSAVLLAEGRPHEARECLVAAVVHAAGEGLRRPFLEHPLLLRTVLRDPPVTSRAFVRSLLDGARSDDVRRAGQRQLVEPLTERELALLELLPTRLSNRELATKLYVSVNTVKTHLRNIYRKLGVADRDAAIVTATELGLL